MATRILFVHMALVHENPQAASHANPAARQVQQPSHQLGQAGGVALSHDAHDGDAAIVFGREQMVGDGLAHRAGLATGGFQVHEQAGPSVDLDDGCALFVLGA